MGLEDNFAIMMQGNSSITSLLTGGIHKSGTVGRDGITRQAVPGAFDGDGELKPIALVRQRDMVPDRQIEDPEDQVASAAQVIEIWLYEENGYVNIDAVLDLLFTQFYGYQFDYCFPAEWINTINRLRDEGALVGASLARQDWSVIKVIE